MEYKKSIYNIFIPKDDYTIAYNSYSGSLCKMNKDGMLCYDSMDDASPIFANLIKQGFLVENGINEFDRVVREYNEYINNNNPETIQFTIALTTACNLKCVYCFEEKNKPEFAKAETLQMIAKYIRHKLSTHKGIKNLHITWFGGEPMLTYDQIILISKQLIKICEQNKVQYSANMVTNGLLLTEEKLKVLSEHGVRSIQITLDGTPDECAAIKKGKKEDFEKLIDNIPLFAKIVKVKVRLNICKNNIHGIEELYNKLTKLDPPLAKVYISKIEKYNDQLTECSPLEEEEYTDIVIEQMNSVSESINNLNTISRFPKRRKAFCGSMQKHSCAIGPDGSIYVCEHSLGDKSHAVGNVRHFLFYQNKKETEYKKYTMKPYDTGCALCKMFPICLGGCPANKVLHNIPFDCESFRKKVFNEIELAVEKKKK